MVTRCSSVMGHPEEMYKKISPQEFRTLKNTMLEWERENAEPSTDAYVILREKSKCLQVCCPGGTCDDILRESCLAALHCLCLPTIGLLGALVCCEDTPRFLRVANSDGYGAACVACWCAPEDINPNSLVIPAVVTTLQKVSLACCVGSRLVGAEAFFKVAEEPLVTTQPARAVDARELEAERRGSHPSPTTPLLGSAPPRGYGVTGF